MSMRRYRYSFIIIGCILSIAAWDAAIKGTTIFTPTWGGYLLGFTLGGALLSLLVMAIIGGIYWLVKRTKLPHFFNALLTTWLGFSLLALIRNLAQAGML